MKTRSQLSCHRRSRQKPQVAQRITRMQQDGTVRCPPPPRQQSKTAALSKNLQTLDSRTATTTSNTSQPRRHATTHNTCDPTDVVNTILGRFATRVRPIHRLRHTLRYRRRRPTNTVPKSWISLQRRRTTCTSFTATSGRTVREAVQLQRSAITLSMSWTNAGRWSVK